MLITRVPHRDLLFHTFVFHGLYGIRTWKVCIKDISYQKTMSSSEASAPTSPLSASADDASPLESSLVSSPLKGDRISSDTSCALSTNSSPLSGSISVSPHPSPQKRKKYGREYFEQDVSSTHQNVSDDDLRQLSADEVSVGVGGLDSSADESNVHVCGHESSSDESDMSCSSVSSDHSVSVNFEDGSDSTRSGCASSSEVDSEGDDTVYTQKLFDSSDKSTDEAVLALMELYITRRWDKTTLMDFIGYCKDFFPSNLPKSVYKLFKYIEDLTAINYHEVKHFYCSDCCVAKVHSEDACQCGSSATSGFFELPLAIQIQHYFEHRKLASLIDTLNARVDDENIILDVCSGSKYKEVREEFNGQYDIILQFNSDGVSLVKSSRAHLYPILATICEVPPCHRSGYMIVCGIWYDPQHPPILNNYFHPFVSSLKDLSVNGVSWTHPISEEKIISRVAAPLLVADALLRADALGMQRFNSKYGCNTCEQKTVRVSPVENTRSQKNKRKVRRFVYRQANPAQLRDKTRIEDQSVMASVRNHAVKGVRGSAVVSEIPFFDRSSSAGPEYMHRVLLGVVKLLLTLWFFTPGEWNIKDKVKDIDKFINNFVKMTDFSRIPRGLKDFNFWKANELRTWLLFISLPALHGILKEKFFLHYMLLVNAIFILLKTKITLSDVNIAETKLRLFVRDIGTLYHPQYYLYNVHNLLHLCQYVRMWGPIWATSAFPYESFNHVLGDLAHGTKHKGQEIVNRIRLAHGVQILKSKVGSYEALKNKDGLLGLPVDLSAVLSDYDFPSEVETYVRLRFKGEIFTTKFYDSKTKRTNSFIEFTTSDGSTAYGQCICFYMKEDIMFSLIKTFKVQHSKIFFHPEGRFKITHLIPVSETDQVVFAPLSAVISKLAKVGSYLCIQPNTYEKNL